MNPGNRPRIPILDQPLELGGRNGDRLAYAVMVAMRDGDPEDEAQRRKRQARKARRR